MLITRPAALSGYSAEILNLEKGKVNLVSVQNSAIIFVRAGILIPFFDKISQQPVSEGEMFFLPQEITCEVKATTKNAEIFILQIPDFVLLSYTFFPDTLFNKATFPGTFSCPLKFNKYIQMWMDILIEYIDNEYADHLVTEIKTLELLFFIKTYYPKEYIADFFSSVNENDYRFVLFVLQNHSRVKTVEELAGLSTYSLSGFEKQFRRIFKIAPYKWMVKQKAENLYKTIRTTTKPLKLIAEEFEFSGLSEMGNFCRRHLGISPKTMRSENN